MRALRLVILLTIACCQAVIASDTFKIDPAQSKIGFSVRHLLGSAKGKFSKFSGTIVVDRDHPEQSSVTATIAAASLDTGIAKRDEHLRGQDFFDVRKYPDITFKSRQVKQTGESSGDIIGDFTMHGGTRSITLHVELLGGADSARNQESTRWRVTTAPLKRSDFKIGSGGAAAMIGNDVSVEIVIQASRAK